MAAHSGEWTSQVQDTLGSVQRGVTFTGWNDRYLSCLSQTSYFQVSQSNILDTTRLTSRITQTDMRTDR